jgi:hypothetical protein
MDSNAAAKLQRPPPHADDDELPAPAPPKGRDAYLNFCATTCHRERIHRLDNEQIKL